VSKYWIEVATDSLFSFKTIDSAVTDTSLMLRNLLNGYSYWWKGRAYNAFGWGLFSTVSKFSVNITEIASPGALPNEFALYQNHPNPFNPVTTVRYALPKTGVVKLGVFSMLGQQVTQLVNGEVEAGYHEVKFDASGLSSGVYLYRMQAGDFVQTRKLLLIR
jgi:hypothetical protein